MLYTICIALILVASVLVILAVLVQNPKSGMAANFGASNQVMGVRETTNFLEKFTWSMAIAIVVLSLAATLAMDRGLVADSNLEISKDAKALQERVIESEAAATMPQRRGLSAVPLKRLRILMCFLTRISCLDSLLTIFILSLSVISYRSYQLYV